MSQNPMSLGPVLRILREKAGTTQGGLERKTGLPRGRVSQLECGDRTLDRAELERLVSALGFAWPSEVIERAAAGLSLVPDLEIPNEGEGAGLRKRRLVEAAAATTVRTIDSLFRERATAALLARPWRRDREEAAKHYIQLRQEPDPRKRQVLVTSVASFQTWAMCERLCAESVCSATRSPRVAQGLADLALSAATRTENWDAWRHYLQGYVWAFVANARRVAGDLGSADRAFETSDALAGEIPPLGCPLDPAIRLRLKASLRKNQGRYAEAFSLMEDAISFARSLGQLAHLRIDRASLCEKAGAFSEALADLACAEPLLSESIQGPRLRMQLAANRALNFWHLGLLGEAFQLLEDHIKPLTLQIGHGLLRLRMRWLEARIIGALGKPRESLVGLQEVWQAFANLKIPFDAALAALELATLLLESGRRNEVRAFAAEAAPIFASKEIPRDLLISPHLFYSAPGKEELTATVAHLFLQEFRRLGPSCGTS